MSNFEQKKQSQCVICHQPIDLSKFGESEIILENKYVGCPNGHLVHTECLKDWMTQSDKCPVCHEKYDIHVINVFTDYLKQVEEDRKRKEKEAKLKEEREKATKDNFDPENEKKFNKALVLIDKGKYKSAINILWDILDEQKYTNKDPRYLKLLFHLGRGYYKMEKPTLAIRQLMKLVKLDFHYPLGFYYLGLSYEKVSLLDKAKWAYNRSLNTLETISKEQGHYVSFIENIQSRLKRIEV